MTTVHRSHRTSLYRIRVILLIENGKFVVFMLHLQFSLSKCFECIDNNSQVKLLVILWLFPLSNWKLEKFWFSCFSFRFSWPNVVNVLSNLSMFLTTVRRSDLIVAIILLRHPVLCGGISVQWTHPYTLFTLETRLINVESFPTYVYIIW
jgi:hypothetical protein